ncbi:hypothetical protein ISP17_11430 [Dyella ginsengisoli]|uniref:Phage tail protein n=1 Tax=Dyella ginsengisoli TaxID=363848 RepID=A0ABW8JTU9_9GAMM
MSYAIGQPVLWPLPPNWATPPTEALAWLTDLQVSRNGTQQKRQLRLAPRRLFGFAIAADADERRLVDAISNDQGTRQVHLPIYPDMQLLAAPLAAGATSVPCTTTGYDFTAGGLAVLWASARQWELLSVATVAADALTLTTATASAWPADTRLYPVRLARLAEPVKFTVRSDDVAEASVSLLVDEPCDWPAVAPTTLYRGVPVMDRRPNEADAAAVSYARTVQTVDEDAGPVTYFDYPGQAFAGQPHTWLTVGRADHAAARSLLYGLAGRAGQWWVPTWRADFRLASPSAASDSSISVEWAGYTVFGREQVNRKDVRIVLTDGTVLLRRILSSSEGSDTETLTLDAPLGVDITPASVLLISFLQMCQLASDTVQITHVSGPDGVCTFSTVWQGVKHDV